MPLKSKSVFLLILFLLLGSSLSAKTKKAESFVEADFLRLETQIQSEYSLEELAEHKANVLDTQATQELTNPLLKLYIAIQWAKDRSLKEAYDLIASFDRPGDYSDLYLFQKTSLLLEFNQLSLAEPLLQELTLKFQTDADVIFLRSHFLAQAQNYLAALETLQTNLKLKQKKGETYLQSGLIRILIFDYKGSLKDLREALRQLDSKETHYRQMAHFQLGLVYLKFLNNKKMAHHHFELGKKIIPYSALTQELDQKLMQF